MSDIFLSYNREDATAAKVFADAFTRAGLTVWWDQTLRSGETYDQVTEDALRRAKAVVVLWSPHSVTSRWVRAEASIADENGTFAPAKIEACDLPVMFRLTQTADLAHWRGEADDQAWLAFLGDVWRMAGIGSSAPEPVVRAGAVSLSAGQMGIPQAGVLPFASRGGNGDELQLLAEDLTEDVTRALAENDYFKVIAARSMAKYRGSAVDHFEIGRTLDTQYLAEGKLQKSAEMIWLTIQLIDTETTNALWSRRFATSASELAERPEDFPRIVGAEIAEQVLQTEMKRAVARPDLCTGWEHLMRVASLKRVHGSGGMQRMLQEARSAVTISPEYGLAHAELAFATVLAVTNAGGRLDEQTRREVRDHLNRALRLDGDNSAVLLLMANTSSLLGDGETCLRLARRVIELHPFSPRGHAALGAAHMLLGQTSEALIAYSAQLNCRGFDNTRSIAFFCIAWCHMLEGCTSEAKEAIDQGLALNPHSVTLLKLRAIVEAMMGRRKAAKATILQIREIEPTMSLEQHLSYFKANPRLAKQMSEHFAVFEEVWNASNFE